MEFSNFVVSFEWVFDVGFDEGVSRDFFDA